MDIFNFSNNFFNEFKKNLNNYLPDGLETIDLDLLKRYDLLRFSPDGIERSGLEMWDAYFEVEETPDRLTLVNDRFVIWIASDKVGALTQTLLLIGLKQPGENLRLEIGLKASGVYNHSKLIMRVLERVLRDTQETERLVAEYEKASKKQRS